MNRSLVREELVNFIADVLAAALERTEGRLEQSLRRILQASEHSRTAEKTSSLPALSTSKRFMDLKEFGAFFSMKPSAARKMLERENLPAGVIVRTGQRRLRVDVAAFERWLASRNAK